MHLRIDQRQHKLQQGNLDSHNYKVPVTEVSEGHELAPLGQRQNIIHGRASRKPMSHTARHKLFRRTEDLREDRKTYPLARGDMICGWSMRKAGLRQRLSRYSPTSLSSNLAVDCGGGQSTFFSLHCKPQALLNT